MRALVSAIASLVLPGYGLAIAGRRRAALGFALGVIALHALVLVTPLAILGAFAARLASAIYGAAVVRRGVALDWLGAMALVVAGVSIAAMVGLRVLVVGGYRIPSASMAPTLVAGDDVFIDKLSIWWKPVERGEVIVFRDPCDPAIDYVKRVVAIGGDTVEIRCDALYVNGRAVPPALLDPSDTYTDVDERRGKWRDAPAARYFEELNGHRYNVLHDIKGVERAQLGLPSPHDFPRSVADVPSCAREPGSVDRSGAVHGRVVEGPRGVGVCEPQRAYLVPPGYLFAVGDNRGDSNDSRQFGPVSSALVRGRVTGIWMTSGEHGASFARVGNIQ